MPRISRRAKWIIAFAIIIVAGYGFSVYWQSRNQVPVAFTNARTQGAIIAQNIVNLSNQSNTDLQQVNQFDSEGNYQAALSSTVAIVAQSQQLRDQAVQLSNQIEAMTTALSNINSFDARQAALEAISSRLALITQLINYSGDLGNLLDALQSRFNGTYVSNTEIQGRVNQINTDVNAINSFNSQANQAMDQFDQLIGK